MSDQVNKVRAIIGDDDSNDHVFKDEQISLMLEVEENVYIAAAMLLERVAREEALLYRWLRTDDLTVAGHHGAKIIMDQAKALRDQAGYLGSADADESFITVFPHDNQVGPGEYEQTRWAAWH